MSEIHTDLSTLEMPPQLYREQLVRTLAHVFKRSIQHPEVQPGVTHKTVAKFTDEMTKLSIEELEKRLYAIQNQNPMLLLMAMKDAGHRVEVDGDGNVQIDDPSDLRGLIGRPVYADEEV